MLSFGFAIDGLKSLIKNEHNSRIHLTAAVLAVGAAIILKINPTEWLLLFIVIGIVFIAELFNSAIEALSDRVEPEKNDLIRNAKDYAAAAVLVSAVIAVIAGCYIFIPKIISLF